MYFCCFREEVVLLLLAFVREISARGNTVITGFILLSRKIATSGVALLAMTEIKNTSFRRIASANSCKRR